MNQKKMLKKWILNELEHQKGFRSVKIANKVLSNQTAMARVMYPYRLASGSCHRNQFLKFKPLKNHTCQSGQTLMSWLVHSDLGARRVKCGYLPQKSPWTAFPRTRGVPAPSSAKMWPDHQIRAMSLATINLVVSKITPRTNKSINSRLRNSHHPSTNTTLPKASWTTPLRERIKTPIVWWRLAKISWIEMWAIGNRLVKRIWSLMPLKSSPQP